MFRLYDGHHHVIMERSLMGNGQDFMSRGRIVGKYAAHDLTDQTTLICEVLQAAPREGCTCLSKGGSVIGRVSLPSSTQ